MQKKKRKRLFKNVSVKGMLFYASLYAVPCNRRRRRQSDPGPCLHIRKISGDSLRQAFVDFVGSSSVI